MEFASLQTVEKTPCPALSEIGKPVRPELSPPAPSCAPAAPRWCGAAAGAPGWHSGSAQDADEHARLLTGWQQHYDQLSAGRFQGRLSEWRLPAMQVFREHTSQALHQRCRVWDDALWFGLPVLDQAAEATRINGRPQTPHSLMLRPGGEAFELRTPAGQGLFGVVVQRSALAEAAERQGCSLDWDGLARAELWQLPAEAHLACLMTLHQWLPEDPAAGPRRPQHAQALQAMQDQLLGLLLDLLDAGQVEPEARQQAGRRQQLVARARALIEARPDEPPGVAQLCEALHVSRRTLQYVFEDQLGLSPLQALRAQRLNGARRQLRQVAAQGLGVQDVAAHWGFWHLSQFGADYRRLFGESPSETLRGGAH